MSKLPVLREKTIAGFIYFIAGEKVMLDTDLAEIAPCWLTRRDNLSAKVSVPKAIGIVSADGAANAYCPYQRYVSKYKMNQKSAI